MIEEDLKCIYHQGFMCTYYNISLENIAFKVIRSCFGCIRYTPDLISGDLK